MKREIQVEYKNVDELIPYANNPRNNDNAVEAVANSIKEFGFGSPIVIDENNEIINGHTRLKAAKFLELKEIPTVTIDWLSEEQKKAYRLADNKTSEIATWDWEILDIEMEELELTDIDMSNFGFDVNSIIDESALDEMFEDVGEQEEKEPKRCPHCGEEI